MKRILITSAAIALLGASSASACLVDSDGASVAHADGGSIAAGAGFCATVLDAAVLDAAVLFSVGSAVLSAEGKAALDGIDASGIGTITGYASVDGGEASNLALSRARAQAVADYLGIDAAVVGGGETSDFGADLASNRVVVLS